MNAKFMYRVTVETYGIDPCVVGDFLFDNQAEAEEAYNYGCINVPTLRWTHEPMRISDLSLTKRDINILAEDFGDEE